MNGIYTCLLCGRNKFTRKQPHCCTGGFRKRKIKWELNNKTMSNFDFNKAINGEPIYCNGEVVNVVMYNPKMKLFDTSKGIYRNDGKHIDNSIHAFLTTDHPKKKVKKTVWVSIAKFLTDDRKYDTSLAYNTKEEASSKFNDTSDLYIGTYPIEIEVE